MADSASSPSPFPGSCSVSCGSTLKALSSRRRQKAVDSLVTKLKTKFGATDDEVREVVRPEAERLLLVGGEGDEKERALVDREMLNGIQKAVHMKLKHRRNVGKAEREGRQGGTERPPAAAAESQRPVEAPGVSPAVRSLPLPGTSREDKDKDDRSDSLASSKAGGRFKSTVNIPLFKRNVGHKRSVVDPFDMIAEYDRKKYGESERDKFARMRATAVCFRKEVEEQMDKNRQQKEETKLEILRDREHLQQQIRDYKEQENREREARQAKMRRQVQYCRKAEEEANRRKDRARRRAEREADEMVERIRRDEEADREKKRMLAEAMKARSAEIQQHVIKSIEEKEMRKQKEREEAIELARRYAEELERKERERLAKIEEQQAKIKRIADTMGRVLAESADKKAREDEMNMIKYVKMAEEKANKEAQEKIERQKATVLKIRQVLQEQQEEKRQRAQQHRTEMAEQAAMWKQQIAAGDAKERAEEAARRERRAQMDATLVSQMHEKQHADDTGEAFSSRLCAVNQKLFQQMYEEGALPEDLYSTVMARAAEARGKRTKDKQQQSEYAMAMGGVPEVDMTQYGKRQQA
ncbi:unnamed protein product [Vitrella brassicaformis CCMP3155]|uniref:Trichohyalin-plectin-homology domain-containing protein n=2 Tax=Vitrella brassicaformis TaxID=1169539 RepID=A0A0G4EU60_VITBC|nr:unnamed protein product [Vitrella brassicaformis CCMP3155]|mmetsp:Transcript_7647/g.18714  ORF Transcript_7647/g.18714 Transcript_7647/m.18714 type:complete len:584 (+) Transcript_7647:593-2344(+)|eukprot:CEM01807.1 unnamed protein product [Vitrella brassicaformis CCMP3155]